MKKTVEELKEQFAPGKYLSAQDFADIFDSIIGAASVKVLKVSGSGTINHAYTYPESTLPEDTLVIIVNTGSDNVTTQYSYSTNKTVTIPPKGAAAFITSNEYDEWYLIGVPVQ